MSEELDGSELGTKEYWDRCYATEVCNFHSHKDPGDVWFGEDSIDRVIRYLEESSVDKNASILDIGCGNGLFLVQLACDGYICLTGADYSEDGVKLARLVAADKHVNIDYMVVDMSRDIFSGSRDHSVFGCRQFDICHDKGTYDAISMSPHEPTRHRLNYLRNVHRLLAADGRFIITSCNWTSEELIHQLSDVHFQHLVTMTTPQFSFGGVSGSVVSCVVFVKCAPES